MKCKVCIKEKIGVNEEGCHLKCPFGKPTNLTHHLKTHESVQNWLKQYKESSGASETQLSTDDFDLTCWFVTSNAALEEVESPFFRKILRFDLPCMKTFKDRIAGVYFKLKSSQEEKVIFNLKIFFLRYSY